MESMERALKALKEIKREIRRKSRSFRRELRKMYKKIVSIERSNPKAPKFSRDTSAKLREKNEDNSDKGPKVSHNTLNEGPKSGKKSPRPKSSCLPNSPTKKTYSQIRALITKKMFIIPTSEC